MKTPEDIKRGMALCKMDECFGQHEDCPYAGEPSLCVGMMCDDALAYIQQLEQDNTQKDKRIRELEREREEMLRQLSMHCEACKYWEAPMSCEECSTCTNPWKANPKENWEWRGVEKEK